MSKCITWWAGMDVHVSKIVVAILRGQAREPREIFEVVADSRGIRWLLRKLKSLPGKVQCVYEAGPCGFELYRTLQEKGVPCHVAAPAMIPRKPGDRVKTDRRDAIKLARAHRAGDLSLVAVPDERQEALRDLVRAREDAKVDVLRRRHRLGKFLLRHGHRYREGRAWTHKHSKWLGKIRFDDPHAQFTLEEYEIGLDQAVEQLQRLTQLIDEAAQRPEYKTSIDHLMTFRGIQTLTAMTLLTEAWDLRRFASAAQFMAATGLVPSEYSSGSKQRRGSITKTGNGHLRRVLVEAAWHYRHRPVESQALYQRRKGQPHPVVAIARRADRRLSRKFRRLICKGKRSTVATVAVARELAGFIWAMGQLPEHSVSTP